MTTDLVMHNLKEYFFTNHLLKIDRGILRIHHFDIIRSKRIILSRESPRDRLHRVIREKIHIVCYSFECYFRSELENEKLDPFIDGDESDLQSEIREKLEIIIISLIDRSFESEFLVIASIARK